MLLRCVAFPDFCEPCLPRPAAKPPAGAGWLHEIKHDGFRIIARKEASQVRLYSRPAACRWECNQNEIFVVGAAADIATGKLPASDHAIRASKRFPCGGACVPQFLPDRGVLSFRSEAREIRQ
jgi:hypothetical protein